MAQTTQMSARVAVYILAFMAVVFSAVGGIFLYFSFDFSNYARATTGTVMSVSESYSDSSVTYQPTIAFVDAQGTKQTGETFLSSSSYNYRPGSKVDILYDTRAPHKLRVDNWFTLWGFPMIFLIVGLVLLVITVIVARVSGKKKPESEAAPRRKKPTASYSYSSNEDTPRPPTVRRR